MSFIACEELGEYPNFCPEKLLGTEWRVWLIRIKRGKLRTRLGKGARERIEMRNYLAAVNERFQVSRCQDPGRLDGNDE